MINTATRIYPTLKQEDLEGFCSSEMIRINSKILGVGNSLGICPIIAKGNKFDGKKAKW